MISTINELNYHKVLHSFDKLFAPMGKFQTDYHFKDSRVSTQRYSVVDFRIAEVFEPDSNHPETYMAAIIEMASFVNTRLILHIREDDPSKYDGLFIMTFDYELPDEVCMELYDQDILIAYEVHDNYGNAEMFYYDQVGIQRRQRIKAIIEY